MTRKPSDVLIAARDKFLGSQTADAVECLYRATGEEPYSRRDFWRDRPAPWPLVDWVIDAYDSDPNCCHVERWTSIFDIALSLALSDEAAQ